MNAQQTKRVYLIGNSLTDAVNYEGLKNLALSQGNSYIWARHSIPGAPLGWLWDHQDGGYTESPYGVPLNAFPNYDWDAVTLQSEGTTPIATVPKYAEILKERNPDVQLYIHAIFPRIPEEKYESAGVHTATADDWENLWMGSTGPNRQYALDLCDALNQIDLGLNKGVLLIPVGDVMRAFNQKAKNGEIPGFSSAFDLYSDRSHQKGSGSYLLSCTFFATIYKQDVRGAGVPANFGELSAELVNAIQQSVYEVVFTHTHSGVSLDDIIAVTSVQISTESLSMGIFTQRQLTVSVLPAEAGNKHIIWSSSNTDVAIVDNNGKVTSLAEGTASITAKSFDGGYTASCEVTVSGTAAGTTIEGILAHWDFVQIQADNNNVKATNTLPGVDSTNVYLGAGVNLTASQHFPNILGGTGLRSADLTSAIGDGEYVSFYMKAEKGKLISVSEVAFSMRSQSLTRTFALLSSVQGFTADKALFTQLPTSYTQQASVPITGHNNLEEVEFRVYIYGSTGAYDIAGIGNNSSGNDIVVTGSIFTPENDPPSTPANLRAIEVKDTYINFEWDASTDDYFVKGYNFYMDGTKKNADLIEGTSYLLDGLSSGERYDVAVEAVDYFDLESLEKGTLSIHANRAPTAVITASATNGEAPLTIVFSAENSTDPDTDYGDFILGFDWDMGDGSPILTSNTATHTFTEAGDYEVSLVVMDSRGMRSESEKIDIHVAPQTPASNSDRSLLGTRVWVDNERLFIETKNNKSEVLIYNSLGVLLLTRNVVDELTVIPIEKGLYIVRFNKKAYKVIVQ